MPSHTLANPVTSIAAESPVQAAEHFAHRLSFETDCADVHDAMQWKDPGFVLLDVRGPVSYARAHVPGALNLPTREIDAPRLEGWPADTLFVVYCAGPHCNGADKAALRLASLGRAVKLMIGGMTGWADEAFSFAKGTEPGAPRPFEAA